MLDQTHLGPTGIKRHQSFLSGQSRDEKLTFFYFGMLGKTVGLVLILQGPSEDEMR